MKSNFIGEFKRQNILNAFQQPVKKSNTREDIAVVNGKQGGHQIKNGINELNADLKKANKKSKISMDRDEFEEEHDRLIGVLESDNKEDDKKEIKKQKKEAKEYDINLKKGGEGSGKYEHKKAHELSDDELKDRYSKLVATSKKMKLNVSGSKMLADYAHEIAKRRGDFDLKKSNGEGSKGGKVIGHTTSGKPIYETADHANHSSFTKEDHYDASDHHDTAYGKLEKKYPKESKRPGDAQKQMSYHAAQATSHWKKYKAGEKDSKELKKAIENIML